MKFFTVITGIVSCVVATAVLLYVSMTTGIGPWFAPTIVLVVGMLFYFFAPRARERDRREALVLTQAIGSVGGSVATAIGFSLTTIYFLQKEVFAAWMTQPHSFSLLLGGVTLAAGLLGAWLARTMRSTALSNNALAFPVSTVIYETIVSQAQAAHAKLLGIGAACAALLGIARDGFGTLPRLLPKQWQVFSFLSKRHFAIDTMPIYWAIGYLAGPLIITPLLVGLLSKYLVVWPLNNHANYLPVAFFYPLRSIDFTLAFCSGIVLVLAFFSLRTYPKMIIKGLRSVGGLRGAMRAAAAWWARVMRSGGAPAARGYRYELPAALFMCMAVLWHLEFSLFGSALLIGMTLLADYQLALFAARTGLATYGRFMTFVMIPLLLICQTSDVQTTFACVFVGIVGAMASNVLFSYKVGELTDVAPHRIHRASILGLFVTSLCVGGIFWLIATSFEMGTPALVAHRGLTRALLLRSFSFNYYVLALGGLFGLVLRQLRINPMLVFGGLVMPNSMVIGLAIGSLVRKLTNDVERYVPFWSGVFAGYSLWMFVVMLRALG